MKNINVVQYQSSGYGSINIQCLGDLTFGTLQVGENCMNTYVLTKSDPKKSITATAVRVGAGWTAPTTKEKKVFGIKVAGGTQKAVDLELLAVAEDFDGDPVGVCWFSNMDTFEDGTLVHTGDNQTGKGVGDDESINALLSDFPSDIRQVTFMVAALKPGSSLQDVEAANLSMYDMETGAKMIGIRVKLNEAGNIVAVASATRQADNTWEVTYLNKYGTVGSTRQQILNFARQVSNF